MKGNQFVHKILPRPIEKPSQKEIGLANVATNGSCGMSHRRFMDNPRPYNWGFCIWLQKLRLSLLHQMFSNWHDIWFSKDKCNLWKQFQKPQLKGLGLPTNFKERNLLCRVHLHSLGRALYISILPPPPYPKFTLTFVALALHCQIILSRQCFYPLPPPHTAFCICIPLSHRHTLTR